MQQNRKKVIIDCDPGIDDALALILALASPELEILGITIMCGNVPVDVGADNALKVLRLMGRLDIPVYTGAERPLQREYVDARETHGQDGLGETNYPEVTDIRPHPDAVEFILNALNRERVSIVALGPLTNIANALRKEEKAFENLGEFVSMGGNYRSHGNCSPVAEYNYWCDPHAAREVFEKLNKPIHMVGLDVTRKIVLTPEILKYIQTFDSERSRFIEAITRFYVRFHWEYERILGCVINDPLAVAYFLDPSLCRGFDTYTTIETEGLCIGQSVVDAMGFWKKESNSHVLTEVDATRFMAFFLSRVFGVAEEELSHELARIT